MDKNKLEEVKAEVDSLQKYERIMQLRRHLSGLESTRQEMVEDLQRVENEIDDTLEDIRILRKQL